MKLALLLFYFAVLATVAVGQKIPKGATQMQVVTPYADSALYASLLVFLDEEGFGIDKENKEQKSLTTEYQRKGKYTLHIRLMAKVADSTITFKGQAKGSALGYVIENEPIQSTGNSMQRKGFEYMDDIVRRLSRRLPGSSFRYVMDR